MRGTKPPLFLCPQLWQLLPTPTWTQIYLWLSGQAEDVMWESFLTLLHSSMVIAGHGKTNLRLQVASLTAVEVMIGNDRILMAGKHLWGHRVQLLTQHHQTTSPSATSTQVLTTIMLYLMWEQRARAGSIGSGWLLWHNILPGMTQCLQPSSSLPVWSMLSTALLAFDRRDPTWMGVHRKPVRCDHSHWAC